MRYEILLFAICIILVVMLLKTWIVAGRRCKKPVSALSRNHMHTCAVRRHRKHIFLTLRLKELILPGLSLIFLLSLLNFSDIAFNSALRGLKLWFNIVFPSLFPFLVTAEILGRTGLIKAAGLLFEPIMRPLFNVPGVGSFAFLMGITSGYPVGAGITASLRENKLISKAEAERLITFTNNSGPLFIIGAVAVGMMKTPEIGPFLLACHILACISVGMIFAFFGRRHNTHSKVKTGIEIKPRLLTRIRKELYSNDYRKEGGAGGIIGEAVKKAVMTLLTIGGFITLFSVIIGILVETGIIKKAAHIVSAALSASIINTELIESLFSGFFEITTGTNMASSSATAVPVAQQLAVLSAIIGWAGLSVHLQVISIISKTDIRIWPYLAGKFLQAIIASIYAIAGVKIIGLTMLKSRPTSIFINPIINWNWDWSLKWILDWSRNWSGYFIQSLIYLLIALIIFALSLSLLSIVKHLTASRR